MTLLQNIYEVHSSVSSQIESDAGSQLSAAQLYAFK